MEVFAGGGFLPSAPPMVFSSDAYPMPNGPGPGDRYSDAIGSHDFGTQKRYAGFPSNAVITADFAVTPYEDRDNPLHLYWQENQLVFCRRKRRPSGIPAVSQTFMNLAQLNTYLRNGYRRFVIAYGEHAAAAASDRRLRQRGIFDYTQQPEHLWHDLYDEKNPTLNSSKDARLLRFMTVEGVLSSWAFMGSILVPPQKIVGYGWDIPEVHKTMRMTLAVDGATEIENTFPASTQGLSRLFLTVKRVRDPNTGAYDAPQVIPTSTIHDAPTDMDRIFTDLSGQTQWGPCIEVGTVTDKRAPAPAKKTMDAICGFDDSTPKEQQTAALNVPKLAVILQGRREWQHV